MRLKTVSQISLAIIALVFIGQLLELYFNYAWAPIWYITCKAIEILLWVPFMLFFWKIIKG